MESSGLAALSAPPGQAVWFRSLTIHFRVYRVWSASHIFFSVDVNAS